ncbi:MAG: RNA-binding protein [Proteobacteria bacterium]|nr:RNA-binding protein [Pseudomonadota bacterium]
MPARQHALASTADSPQRRCIVTGEVKDKSEMVRFAVGPDGRVVPDVAGNLPGRGLWLTASREVVETAVAKGRFAKAARGPTVSDVDLADQVGRLLARRCLDLIGLARRAGQAVTGFEKVRACLRQDDAAVLLAASDGAGDGRAKLSGLAGSIPEVAVFSRAELSSALGRENVVHAALRPGGLAGKFKMEAARLAGFRVSGPTAGTAV